MDRQAIALYHIMEPQADPHGPPLRIDQRGHLGPGRLRRGFLPLEHLCIPKADRLFPIPFLVREFQAQADIHRTRAQAVQDLLGIHPAVHPQSAGQDQIHCPVGHGIVVLFRRGDPELKVQRSARGLIAGSDVRLLPIFQAPYGGGHVLQPAPGLRGPAPVLPLLEGEAGHGGEEGASRGVDQLQLRQIDRRIPAAQMTLQRIHPPEPLLQALLIPAKPAFRPHLNILLEPMAAQLHIQFTGGREESAVRVVDGEGSQRAADRVDGPRFLRALPELQADLAVFAGRHGALPLQAEVDGRRLLVLDHQDLRGEFLSGADRRGKGEDQSQLLTAVEDRDIVSPLRLQQAAVFRRLGGQEQPVSLPGHIELTALSRGPAHCVHRFQVRLVVGQAKICGIMAAEALMPFQHRELAEDGLLHHDHPALVIQRHPALDQKGGVVAGDDAQAADHACTVREPAEKLLLSAHILLLHLKIPNRQQLSEEIPVPFKREKICVTAHGLDLRSSYHSS